MCHVREFYSGKRYNVVDRMPLPELQEGAQSPAVPSHSRAAAQKAFEETLVEENSEADGFADEFA